MFIKGPGFWVYSLPSPMTLTLPCPTNPIHKHVVTLEGQGVLMLQQGCSAHRTALTLPAHDTVVDGPPITVSRSPLPASLFPLVNLPGPLNGSLVPDVPPLHSEQSVPLQELLARMQPLTPPPPTPTQPSHSWLYMLFGVLAMVLALALGAGQCWMFRSACRHFQQEVWQMVTVRRSTPAIASRRSQGRDLPEGGLCGNPAPGNPATVTNTTLLPTLEEEDEVSS